MASRITTGRLCLVDGNALLFQAFYGNKADLYNPKGVKVNGVYTFLRSIISLLERPCDLIRQDSCSGQSEGDEIRPLRDVERMKYISAAVCWDHPSKTARTKEFSGYKSNRSPMPEELKPQFPLSMQAIASLGIAQFQIPSVEADDLIATIAKLSSAHESIDGVDIISPDKDMLQMVNDDAGVTVEHSHTGKVYDESGVLDRYGVLPECLPELFALIGDKVDNLPGVPGVGPKRAAVLMKECGSIENILEATSNYTSEKKTVMAGLKLVDQYLNQKPRPSLTLQQATELNRMRNDIKIPEFLECTDILDILSFPPLPRNKAELQSTQLYNFILEQNFKSML